MTTPTDTVRDFYAKLADGDAPGALDLMAPDIEWTTTWHYKADRPSPQAVAEGLLTPLANEWTRYALQTDRFIAEGDTVVSLGRFTGVHGASKRPVDAAYAHVWTVHGGRIQRFRQYIDTLAVAEART